MEEVDQVRQCGGAEETCWDTREAGRLWVSGEGFERD